MKYQYLYSDFLGTINSNSGRVRKIDEMFNRIKDNAALPQSVGFRSRKITKPSDPGLEDYRKVTGLSSTTDGASNCIPDSADP